MSKELETQADDAKIGIRPFYMTDIMKVLSELECLIWDNSIRQDKVTMQNMVTTLKHELMRIDKENKDIITVNGLKYKMVYE